MSKWDGSPLKAHHAQTHTHTHTPHYSFFGTICLFLLAFPSSPCLTCITVSTALSKIPCWLILVADANTSCSLPSPTFILFKVHTEEANTEAAPLICALLQTKLLQTVKMNRYTPPLVKRHTYLPPFRPQILPPSPPKKKSQIKASI